ncbi:MAG: hypothetical protein NTU69_12835 [Proteobacteria bacterium]|nr:hypothetical protein [Pseudomonadota bacterium]
MLSKILNEILIGFGSLNKRSLTWEAVTQYVDLFNQARGYFKNGEAYNTFLDNTLSGGKAYAEQIVRINESRDTLEKTGVTPQQAVDCLATGLPGTRQKPGEQTSIPTVKTKEGPTYFEVEITPQYLGRKIKALAEKPLTLKAFDEQIELISETEKLLGSGKALTDFFNELFPSLGSKYADALKYMKQKGSKDIELLRKKAGDEAGEIDKLERYFSAYMRVFGFGSRQKRA